MERLIGKTIVKIEKLARKHSYGVYDDVIGVRFHFSDGTSCVLEPYYSSYTGNSIDEYPTGLCVSDNIDMEDDSEVITIETYN